MGFIGLPTPANALFWGALIVGANPWIENNLTGIVMIVGVLISSWLLVSEIPMFALKFKHWGWKGNEVKYLFIISSAIIILLFQVTGIAVVIAWYVLLSALVRNRS